MRRFLLIAGLVFIFMCESENPTNSSPPDNPFVGSWIVRKLDNRVSSWGTIWTFGDTTLSVNVGVDTFWGSYSHDPTAQPKTIDVKLTGTSINPNLAIYDFVMDTTLILKLMDGNTARATSFEVEANYDLQELSKVKQ